ncbi:MAG: hypothetical protein KBG20_06765 [Caldilineaceae bacterium]|nr:hypothetical protein [Caldilineaceae bacterium]MBP8106491.1 hypothetical protein [Caldilineaceae bacterium]MBP8121251.1 hypothetical protein [Caldilineaceae bacterium]MBP9071980.1 hypothetical protein [Caldilineaceae bacterium]
MTPHYRRTFPVQQLLADHPPKPQDPNKLIVFALTCPANCVHSGEIHVSRWSGANLPATIARSEARPTFELRPGFFTYDPSVPGWSDWHLNFAHWDLFAYYAGYLFAQDEMQVTEHPALASVRHALLDSGLSTFTVEQSEPTPILVAGVERRCAIATEPNSAGGRPHGLYGNHFARASGQAIERATTLLTPPTVSNILAIEAPANGRGRYTEGQIRTILTTAYTGFGSTVAESRHLHGSETQIAIHTGYWGCGAYGGNRVLMPLLQMLAAVAAGVHTLVFHAGADVVPYQTAHRLLDDLLPIGAPVSADQLVQQILAQNFKWGVGDGT